MPAHQFVAVRLITLVFIQKNYGRTLNTGMPHTAKILLSAAGGLRSSEVAD